LLLGAFLVLVAIALTLQMVVQYAPFAVACRELSDERGPHP
jgi:hypothetical protein